MPNKGIKNKFLETYDQYKTQSEAAKSLNTTNQYIYTLCRKYGIDKWFQKNRIHKEMGHTHKICEECGEMFTEYVSNNPGRFCSNICKGRHLGKNYGYGRNNLKLAIERKKQMKMKNDCD